MYMYKRICTYIYLCIHVYISSPTGSPPRVCVRERERFIYMYKCICMYIWSTGSIYIILKVLCSY